jgi:ankyrin repeat protein
LVYFHLSTNKNGGHELLPVAAENGHSEIVRLLVEKGAVVNSCMSLVGLISPVC